MTILEDAPICISTARDIRWNISESGKKFNCRMIEPGLVSYLDQGGGIELLKKETIAKCLQTAVGNPLTIDHVNVTPKNFEEVRNGMVEGANESDDGWFYVWGSVDTEKARSLIRCGQAPSCAYRVTSWGPGGTYHGIKYDREITGLTFQHLAIVEKPRYEGSQFRLNSLIDTKSIMKLPTFLRKIFTRENSAAGEVQVEKTETVEIPLDAEISHEGKTIKFNGLLDLWKTTSEAVTRQASMEDEVEIDGERVNLGALVTCYKNSKKLNSVETEEQKKVRLETERRNGLTPEKRAEEDAAAAKEIERKNGAFITLHAAREKPVTDGGYSTTSNSLKEKVERGAKKY